MKQQLNFKELEVLGNGKFITYLVYLTSCESGGSRGHDRMIVGFTTTCAIGAWQGFLWVLRFPPPIKLTVLI